MDCELFITPSNDAAEALGLTSYALRMKAPDNVQRVATHFILLIDVSESMMEAQKLEHVKRCSSLILNFMKDEDHISLISFGEDATLHLKRVSADEGNKTVIRHTIEGLHCLGCTNLSAGLGYVREVCEGDTQKAGLLILTDGHANRGLHHPAELRGMIGELSSSFPHLSVHCVAYGSDHNEELMRSIAEDSQGSYNVVNSIEDTAFAFGDTLGGLMSCAYQNVRIDAPPGTIVGGPYKTSEKEGRVMITIGDVYAGTKPLVLFKTPPLQTTTTTSEVHVHGMTLPDLKAWTVTPLPKVITERQKDIELTRLRYLCTLILKNIKDWSRLTPEQQAQISGRIDAFETAVNDPFLNDDPVGTLLREEVQVLRDLLERAQYGYRDHDADVLTTQHIASIGLARGFSSPMSRGPRRTGFPRAPSRPAREQFGNVWSAAASVTLSDDSNDPSDEESDPVHYEPSASAFQNNIQTELASLMRTASQQPQ